MSEDTDLQEAIVQNSTDPKVCAIHKPLVNVLGGLSKRMRRFEFVGVATMAMVAGLVGKDLLIPLLMKILGGP
jgi:hypothetical protein